MVYMLGKSISFIQKLKKCKNIQKKYKIIVLSETKFIYKIIAIMLIISGNCGKVSLSVWDVWEKICLCVSDMSIMSLLLP